MAQKYSHKKMKRMMKEDDFASGMDKLLKWVRANRGLVIAAAVVLFLAVTVYVVGSSYIQGKQNKSERALAGALEIIYYQPAQGETPKYESPEKQHEAALAELDHVMDLGPTESVAERVRYYRADIYLQMNEEDKAIEQLDQLMKEAALPFKVLVAIKYAGVLENRGELDKAVSELDEVLNVPMKDGLVLDYALLMKGRILLRKGQTEAARLAFDKLVTDYPESRYVTQAQDELDKING